MNRFERLLVMVPWLLKNQGISHQEVADHFQISKAQVLQDMMLLTVTGVGQFANQQFDVDYENDRIYVRDQLGLDRPFKFDSTEASCLLLGLQSLENIPKDISGFDVEEIQSVRERISSAIPINAGIHVVQTELDNEIALIAEAITEGKRITFNYWNDARDDVTPREVSPLRIYTINQIPKLDGYDHLKGWRTFRIQNMDQILKTAKVNDFNGDIFQPMNTVEVEISLPLKSSHLLEHFLVVKRKAISDSSVKATIRISEPLWLARQVLASGCTIEVLSPANVVETVDSYVASARSVYPKFS